MTSTNKKPLDHKIWPIGLVIAMTVFVAVILAMVTVAVNNRPQLVSEHYYADSYDLKELVAERSASQATGWKLSLTPLPLSQADMPLLQLKVREANDEPCDSLQGEISLYRPSDKALDITAATVRPMGAGKYFIVLPRALEHGAWQALVNVSRGKQKYRDRLSFFVDE
jgi:nitrogen fixation protein FixH